MCKEFFYIFPGGPKLNLGCGPVQPEGWINIDGSNVESSKTSFRSMFMDAIEIKELFFTKPIRSYNLEENSVCA